MLQELAARTDAAWWAIGSMLFFVAAWLIATVSVARARPEDLDACARLVFDDPSTGSAPTRRCEGGSDIPGPGA
jgi:hypothetical protein